MNFLPLALVFLFLSACGGGENSSGCGGKSTNLGIDFAEPVYELNKDTTATIYTIITPQSCRSSMHFSSYDGGLGGGPLPEGMSIVGGNLVGAPKVVGSYKYRIVIDSVDGYQSSYTKAYSRLISINVN